MGTNNQENSRVVRASKHTLSLAISAALIMTAHSAGAEDFIPQLKAHGKPQPYAVMPLYDLNQPGGEMPMVQPQAEPVVGALDTVAKSSSRNAIVGSSYNSATNGHETFADARKKASKFYGRAIVVDESAGSYDGASGTEQRFGYDRQAGQFVVGTTPRSSTDIKLVYVRDIIKDNKVPTATGVPYNGGTLKVAEGYGVDPVDTDRQIAKLMWDEKIAHPLLKKLHLELFSISLDRTADNFSLRDTAAAQQQKSVVDRTMTGLKMASDLSVKGKPVKLELSYTDIDHDAKRYGGPMTPGLGVVTAYQYPGVEMKEWLLATTTEFALNNQHKLTLGLNYKYVDADATKATLETETPNAGRLSSQDLYQAYYGNVELDQSEGKASAKFQWDYDNQSDLTAYASVANFFRSPDTQERYFAVASFNTNQQVPIGTSARAVGNPEIDWEQHRRIEAGATKSSSAWVDYGRTRGHDIAWQLGASAYYDNVDNFITRDRARGQTSTGAVDFARIWRNVDATLTGLEIDAKANLTKNIASRVVLNYSKGENTSDNRDLYYVSPFEANLFVDYFDYFSTGGTWNVGTQVRHVAKQNHVDDNPNTGSDYDAGETDSFTVVNLYASAQLWDRVGMKVGVNNLTDKSYSDSMAKFPLEGNRWLVEAPERHFYVAVTANF